MYVGGTIFFVVYVNDSGNRAAIYYVKLLPYDLKKYLKTYDGTPYKEKSIELKEFPKKKNDITDVFLDFVHHMNLVLQSIALLFLLIPYAQKVHLNFPTYNSLLGIPP